MLDSTNTTAALSLWLVIAVFTVGPVLAVDKVCSIGRHGSLTRFNGETVTVALPCKYCMADFTCAQYRVKVTPGSSVDEEGGFNPDTVWVKVVDLTRGEEGTFRTSLKRLAKYDSGEVSSPWRSTGGFLSVADDAVSYNRSARAVTFSPVDQLSVVMLTQPPSVLLTCKADDFSSQASPETLCGDGTASDSMERAALRLLGDDSDLTTPQFIHYTVMNDVTVTQSATCRAPASKFQTCSSQKDAARTCHVIFDDPSRAACLLQSGTALHHYYTHCLRAVCDGDASATVAMDTYVRDNCSGPIDETELYYRIVPNPLGSGGSLHSMLLLDGDRLLLLLNDLSELRLVDLQDPNTTLSSVQVPKSPLKLAQLSNGKILVSLYDESKLWLVRVSGDVVEVEGEVDTEKDYLGICPGPNNTFWASCFRGCHRRQVDQLDLQGDVLRTVFHGQYQQVFHLRHYGDFLYLFTLDGRLGVLSPATGEVATRDLGPMLTYDLVYDHKGDAYVCAGGEVCGEAGSCVVHFTTSGQETVLPNFFSGTAQLLKCVDLILTNGQLLVSWLAIDQASGKHYSEITVQRLD